MSEQSITERHIISSVYYSISTCGIVDQFLYLQSHVSRYVQIGIKLGINAQDICIKLMDHASTVRVMYPYVTDI